MSESSPTLVTSPAMKLIVGEVNKMCYERFTPMSERYLRQARFIMYELDRMVNPAANMSQRQAMVLADYIVKKWVPTELDFTDVLEPKISMATYINSCRA